eukprot:g36301.t1
MENYTTAGELKNPKYGYYRVEDIECGATALCLAQASSTAAPQVFTRTGYAFEVEPRLTKQLARHNMEPKNNSKLMGLPWTICLSADECKQVRSLKLHELFRRNEASLEAWCKSLQQARLPGKGSSLNGMQGLPVSVGLPISEFKTRDLKDIEAGVYILVLQENCPGVKVRVPENVGQDLHNHLNTAASGPKKIQLHRLLFASLPENGKKQVKKGTHVFLTKGVRGERPESMLAYANCKRVDKKLDDRHRPFDCQPTSHTKRDMSVVCLTDIREANNMPLVLEQKMGREMHRATQKHRGEPILFSVESVRAKTKSSKKRTTLQLKATIRGNKIDLPGVDEAATETSTSECKLPVADDPAWSDSDGNEDAEVKTRARAVKRKEPYPQIDDADGSDSSDEDYVPDANHSKHDSSSEDEHLYNANSDDEEEYDSEEEGDESSDEEED